MVIAVLVAAWVVGALLLALFLGRSLAVADKSDRWRHGHREVRDLRRLSPIHLSPVPTESTDRAA